MKKEFLENLFKDLELEEGARKVLIKSILDENGNDLNNEKAKTEGVKNDLKVKNALIEELNAKIKEAGSVDIEEIKRQGQNGTYHVADSDVAEAIISRIKIEKVW